MFSDCAVLLNRRHPSLLRICSAGGCPLAETLAEAGLSVLLLERGSGVLPPETANKRDTWDAVRCCTTTGTTILPTSNQWLTLSSPLASSATLRVLGNNSRRGWNRHVYW